MTDTFYPHIFVEAGYIGFVCYLLAVICLFKYLAKNSTIEIKRACFFSCIYLLLCSITAPIMNDAFSIILCATILLMVNNGRLVLSNSK
jgi:hypothetical protein